MSTNELQAKGAEIRRQLLGDAHIARAKTTTFGHPMMADFIEHATTHVFGALWGRPGLDLKTRSMIVVTSDVAAGRIHELPLHLRMALRQGWTQAELGEAFMQLIGYVGLPLVREAMLTAVDVFKEVETENANPA